MWIVEHILQCDIDGEWNILHRNNEFTLKNHAIINAKFIFEFCAITNLMV